jgi:hypothetical protein
MVEFEPVAVGRLHNRVRAAWGRSRLGVLFLLSGVALAIVYSVAVPQGLPYDEPAHWANVTFIAEHWRLPVLGDPGTSYEAQMGPVVYVLDALLLKAAGFLGLAASAPWVVRFSGLALLGAMFWCVWRVMVSSAQAFERDVCTLAAALVVGTPMVVGMGMSVQNDVLALVLAIASMQLASGAWNVFGSATGTGLVTGLAVGLAVLTKLTVLPVVVAAGWVLWRRFGRTSVPTIAVMVLTASTVSSWWFVRNLQLYGDLSGRSGVEASGVHFGPLPWQGLTTVAHLGRQAVTYLWVPVEYYRNTLTAPLWVEVVVIVSTVAMLPGVLALIRSGGGDRVWLLLGAAAVTLWVVVSLTQQAVAFRTAYLVVPAWGLVVAGTLQRIPRRWRPWLVGLVLVVLHAWVLVQVGQVSYRPGLTG